MLDGIKVLIDGIKFDGFNFDGIMLDGVMLMMADCTGGCRITRLVN